MRGIKPINRCERLVYIDHFHTVRHLAIDSPLHFLLFDEDLSPVLQALTPPSARKDDASPFEPAGGLMEQINASIQRDCSI